ncbi:DNA replication and repair protein RecO [Salinibacillus kushneri]|uniref:DNA repair protein RecO n=1 Tax=Salinibacillus kushneri TaxID=237682 RepID=A0A1I0FZ06_9BACI|nr:DNA repair protein RecO [Salinibacillus kushneri]SET63674.1 DNA replication and repair protein RecO [Salinibacillus kushneri]
MEKVEGMVIRTQDYGETHKIVTLFTKEKGKIGLMARGAKKPKSQMAAITQPFVYGEFLIQPSRNLGTLYQGEITHFMRRIREDIVKTAHAAYLAELTDKILENQVPDLFLYEQFVHTFERMQNEENPEILSMVYELKVFEKGGFAPELNQCVNCGRKEGITHFSVQEGGLLCYVCSSVDSHALPLNEALFKLLRTIRYVKIERIGNISIKEENRKKIRQILDAYYDYYGGFYIKSRKFLKQLDQFE